MAKNKPLAIWSVSQRSVLYVDGRQDSSYEGLVRFSSPDGKMEGYWDDKELLKLGKYLVKHYGKD